MRGHRLRRGRQGPGRPDGRSSCLGHERACRRPTTPPTPSRSRSGSPTRERAGGPAAARRSWTARPSRRSPAARPPTSGPSARRSPRERAAAAPPSAAPRRRRDAGDRLGRGRRSAPSRPIRSSSRSAGSATGCSPRRRCIATAQPGGRLKLHTYHLVREDQQALYGFRTAEELGFFNLLLTVTGVGPEGRPGDRRAAGRPPTSSSRSSSRTRPCSCAIPGSARSSPSGSSSSSRRRSPRPASRRRVRPVAGPAASEGEVVAALQALGYSLAEAREASRAALADVGVASRSRSGSRPRCGASSATSPRRPVLAALRAAKAILPSISCQPEPTQRRLWC